MKGGAFYEIRQGVDYDTEIKETEIEGEYGYNASSQASLQKKEVGLPWGPARRAGWRFRRFLLVRMWKLLQKGGPTRSSPGPDRDGKTQAPDSYVWDAWKLLCKFLDGKKTFYFNTEDDFTTMQELLGETVKEKESDWREQL